MHSYSYVGEVNTNLLCCICHCPFFAPVVTTTCSHTFCKGCIERSLARQPCCPVDRSPLSLDDLKPENLLLRNMVDELMVECTRKESGCQTTCQRQLLDVHLRDVCQFVQVPCSEGGCDQMVLRRDLGKHTHDCVHRLMKCVACGTFVAAHELEAHRNECVEQDAQCVACSTTCKRGDLVTHTATCPEVAVHCEQSNQGCSWIGRRKLLSEHLEKCPYEAIKGFFVVNAACISGLRDENTVLRQNLRNAEAGIHTLSRELAIARRALGPWWRSTESPRVPSVEITESTASAQLSQFSAEQHRWRATNPLLPIVTFSPEASPVSASHEVEADSYGASPIPSLTDPAFLASYFPSGGTVPSEGTYAQSPSAPQSVHVDHLTRHFAPFPNRMQSIYPPPPIRFPDLPTSQAPAASALPRVAPVDRSASLEGALFGLRNSVSSVSNALDSLARHTDVALTTENLRMNEEVGALRAIVHGLRMQVHALITERNGAAWGSTTTTTYYNQQPPPPNPPLVINSTTQTTKL